MFYRTVRHKRSASMTDEEIVALQAKAREHALDLQMVDAARGSPVAPCRILCQWCRDYHSPEEVELCMALPEKRAIVGASASSTSSALGAGLLTPFSELWAVLTATSYPDGRPRLTGRLSLSCESSLLKLTLTDNQTGHYACLTGSSLDDLLLSMEAGLSDGTCPWRLSTFDNGKTKKK